MIGDGLTSINENGTVEPNLAASWESVDKGKTWAFRLKDGVVWQDGKPVVSRDVVYGFSDVAIERPDDKTIIFQLQNPFSPFPSVVARPTFRKGLLGTGQWKVTRATISGNYVQQLVLVNKNRDKKIYKFYPTEDRAKLAFKLGAVDILLGIFNPQPFESWKTVELKGESNTNQYVAVFFNTEDKLLSDKSLRQALAYAINKEEFGATRAYGPLSPNSWAYNPQVKPYNYDAARAKELIDELDSELKENLSVKLVSTASLLSAAEKIAKSWEAVGVKTQLQVSSAVPSEYQALLAIYDIPQDPDQYAIWHSTQGTTNISNYKNPRIDKLLEDGRAELNMEERKKIYLDFQRFLVEDSPAAFLYHPVSYAVTRK